MTPSVNLLTRATVTFRCCQVRMLATVRQRQVQSAEFQLFNLKLLQLTRTDFDSPKVRCIE